MASAEERESSSPPAEADAKISLEPTEEEEDNAAEQATSERGTEGAENGEHNDEGENHADDAEGEQENETGGTTSTAASTTTPKPLSQMRPTLKGTFDVSAGSWIGEWAMSDAEYEIGVRGKFEYARTPAAPDVDVGKPEPVEGQPPDMFVSGWFTLQNLANPSDIRKKKESDILIRFAAQEDGTIAVKGFGKNEFGTFSLTGTYDVATSSLDLYRIYQPRASDSSKKSKSKKASGATPGATPKRSTPRVVPTAQSWDTAAGTLAGPAAAVSQRNRRPPAHVIELGEAESKVKSRMMYLVDQLLNLDKARFFHNPVDPVRDGVPHYLEIIKDPMDLGTIKRKLLSGEYAREEEVGEDINRTFSNAMIFNPVGHPVYLEAKALLTKFETEFPKIISKRDLEIERKRKSSGSSAPPAKSNGKKAKLARSSSGRSEDSGFSEDDSFASASNSRQASRKRSAVSDANAANGENEELRLLRKQVELMSKQLESLKDVGLWSRPNQMHESQQADPPYTQSAPKRPRVPKARPQSAPKVAHEDLDYEDELAPPRTQAPKAERPLSYQEKKALGQDINKLPADKIQRVLDIIAESGSQMIGDGAEEVEIDIEKIDTPTLKALQKYVRDVLRVEKKKAIQGGVM